MALQKQNISINMFSGIDTKSDNKQQGIGQLVVLENAVYTTTNETNKRPGYTGLGTSVIGSATAISSGRGIAAYKDELVMNSNTNFYSYSTGSDAWVNKGSYVNTAIEAATVVRNTYQQTCQDSCYHSSGLQCFVWEDSSGGSRYSIIDYATKQQIVSNQSIASTAQKPKAFAVGRFIVITYWDTSATDILMLRIPVATPSATPAQSALTADAADSVYDGMVIGDNLFICYNNGSTQLCQFYVNPFLTISSVRTIAATTATEVAVFGDDSNNMWVAYYDGTNLKAFARSYLLPSTFVVAVTTVEVIANVRNLTGSVVSTTATIVYEISNGTTINYKVRKNTITTAAAVGTAGDVVRSLSLASKSFVYNSIIYFVGCFSSSLQPTYFLMNTSGSVVAKIAPLSAGGLSARAVIPQVNLISAGIYEFAYLQKSNATAVDGVIVAPSGVTQGIIDFTKNGLITSEVASNLHIGGGYLAEYDGANLVEHGFHLFPEVPSATGSNGAGSIAPGTYQYCVTYEWVDNEGQLNRSAPSLPVTITIAGPNDTITVITPSLRVTAKSNVIISVYRTINLGTVFYLVSSYTSPTANTTTGDTVDFVDLLPDASIIGNDVLYTTGGEVENISIPATNIITTFKTRLVGVPSENPYQWWYSKQVIPGVPVEFSDLFVSNINQLGGPITAAGELDDKIIFFKESIKFYVYGDGPAPSGANNTFSDADRVTSDGGCVNQRSIVSTPMGLMYQSLKGIYLLDRGLADNYIGSAVEDYTKSANVTSAVLIANTNQVRFTMDSGYILVYDYFVKQWYTFTNLTAADAVNFNAGYCLVQSAGQVLQETADLYTDAGRPILQRIQTGWLNFANVQGFQRVWKMLLMGDFKSPHKLRISIAKDFNPNIIQETYIDLTSAPYAGTTWGDSATWGSDDYWGGAYPAYQFRVFLAQQKCETIQVTIEEVQTSDYGQGFSLSDIAFEVGVKKGLNKLPAAASYG